VFIPCCVYILDILPSIWQCSGDVYGFKTMTWCLLECVILFKKQTEASEQWFPSRLTLVSFLKTLTFTCCFYGCSQWGMYRKGCGVGNLLSVWQRPSTLAISKSFWSKAFGVATCVGHRTRKLIRHHYNGKGFNMSGVLAIMIYSRCY